MNKAEPNRASGEPQNRPAPKPGTMAAAIVSLAPDSDVPRYPSLGQGKAGMLNAARNAFFALPESVMAADGRRILLHNPDDGWFPDTLKALNPLEKRAVHLMTEQDRVTPSAAKARWIPMIPATVEHAQMRLKDQATGNDIYVRKYADGSVHMVVVSRARKLIEQGAYDAGLITHMKDAPPSRHGNMPVEWRRSDGPGGSQASSAPYSPDSSGARPSSGKSTDKNIPDQGESQIPFRPAPEVLASLPKLDQIKACKDGSDQD